MRIFVLNRKLRFSVAPGCRRRKLKEELNCKARSAKHILMRIRSLNHSVYEVQ